MMPKSGATREQAQVEHLELVRALSLEITAAIAAIEKNDLQQFQTTIANQERICHQLVARKWTPPATGATEKDPVHEAYVALAQQNRVYAGVIRRSKRCADLLSALYGSCGVGYGNDVSALANRQSLTCEV